MNKEANGFEILIRVHEKRLPQQQNNFSDEVRVIKSLVNTAIIFSVSQLVALQNDPLPAAKTGR